MKVFYGIIFSVVVCLLGCQNLTYLEEINQFSTANDTLVIRTEKVKGYGLFSGGTGSLDFRDTAGLFPYPVIFPKGITDIKGAQEIPDFSNMKLDFIDIISGMRGNEEVFIVDQNNNQDFTDDTVRLLQAIDYSSSENLISCEYLISNGEEVVQDSSWVRIGISRGRTRYGRVDHLTADFSLGEHQYTVGVRDQMLTSGFNYGADPEIALLAQDSTSKDTLYRQDLLKMGEYLNLNSGYYRFDSITNDGKYITLVKEMNFASKVGTQVGMLAPDFDCVTVNGDTINSSNLQNKPIILANSCGCGGDELSPQAFDDLKQAFGDKIYALRLDSGIENDLQGWHIDTEDTYNKDIYDKYRQAYCSRIAYLVGKNRRIVDKFDIVKWEDFMLGHVLDPVNASNN